MGNTFSNAARKAKLVRRHEKKGDAFLENKKYGKAIECYEKALNIVQELADKDGERRIQESLGNAYLNNNHHEKAIESYEKAVNIAQELEDKDGERRIQESLGNAYLNNNQHEKAIECYGKALNIAPELEDKDGERRIQESLGNTYLNNNHHEKAIECYNKALNIAQELEDKDGDRRLHELSGNAYLNTKQHEKAIECYQKTLNIGTELEDKDGERRLYELIGNAFFNNKQYEKAIECYGKALNIALQELADKDGKRRIQESLGNAYLNNNHHEKAIECYNKALNIARELEDKDGERRLYELSGNAYFNNQHEKAIECYGKALNIALQELADKDEERRIQESLGQAYLNNNQHEKAIECYNKALNIARELEDKDGERRLHELSGNAFFSYKQFEKAIECYGKALNIAQELEDKDGERRLYELSGNAYFNNKYEKAIGCYEKALDIATELRDVDGQRRLYQWSGDSYFNNKQYEKAIECYKKSIECYGKALNIAPELEDKDGERKRQESLGNAYLNNNQHEKAIEFYDKALNIAQELQDEDGERRLYEWLGNAYSNNKQHKKAIECYDNALNYIAQDLELDGENGQKRLYEWLGDAYFNNKQHKKAIECYEKALNIGKELQDGDGERRLRQKSGNAYHKNEQYGKAIECYEKALNLAQKFQDKDEEKNLQESLGDAYYENYQHKKAIEYYEQHLLENVEATEHNAKYAKLYEKLGNSCAADGQFEKAIGYRKIAGGILDQLAAEEEMVYDYVEGPCDKNVQYEKKIKDQQRALKAVEDGDKNQIIRMLKNLANTHYAYKKYEKAIECYERMLKLAKELGKREEEKRAYKYMAEAYSMNDQNEKMIECAEKVLELSQKLGARGEEKAANKRLADAHFRMGQYKIAIDYYENTLKLARDLEDRDGEKTVHEHLIIHYEKFECHTKVLKIEERTDGQMQTNERFVLAFNHRKQKVKAIAGRENALQISQKFADKSAEGKLYENLGECYFQTGQRESSFRYYTEALKVTRQLTDKDGERRVQERLGDIYMSDSQYGKALKFFEEAAKIGQISAECHGSQCAQAQLQEKLANVYRIEKQFDKQVESLQKALEIVEGLKDKSSESRVLESLGEALYSNRQYDKAIKYYLQALNVVKIIVDKSRERNILKCLEQAYNKKGQHDKALDSRQRSLKVTEELGKTYTDAGLHEQAIACYLDILEIVKTGEDERKKIHANRNLGDAYSSLCQYPKAVEFYKEAYRLCSNKTEENEVSILLERLGYALLNNDEYENAIESYEKALIITRHHEKAIQECLAKTFCKNKKNEEGIKHYKTALNIAKELDDKDGQRRIHELMINAYYNSGQFDQASECYRELRKVMKSIGSVVDSLDIPFLAKTVEIAQECEDNVGITKAYKRLGDAYLKRSDYKKANECFEKALQIVQVLGDKNKEISLLECLGNVCLEVQDYRKMIEWFGKCIVTAQDVGDKHRELNSLEKLGLAYSRTGNLVQTNECYEKVLAIAHDLQCELSEARAHMALGINHNATGRYSRAIQSHFAGIKLARKLKEKHEELRGFINLGIAFSNMNELENANACYKAALKTVPHLGDDGKTEEGEVCQQFGIVYCKMAKYTQAIESHEKALEIAHEARLEKNQFDALIGLGFIHRKIGEDKKGIHFCQQALIIAQKLVDKRLEGTAYYHLGLAYHKIADSVKMTTAVTCHETSTDELEAERTKAIPHCIEALLKALRIVQELDEKEGEKQACLDLETAYLFTKEYQKADECQQKAVFIAREILPDPDDQNSHNSSACFKVKHHEKHLVNAQEKQQPKTTTAWYSVLPLCSFHSWATEKASQFFCEAILAQDSARRMMVHQDDINTSISNMYSHRHTYLVDCLLSLHQVNTALLVLDICKAKALENLMRRHISESLDISGHEINTRWIETIKKRPCSPETESLFNEASSHVARSIQDGSRSILEYGFDSHGNLHVWVVSKEGVFHKYCETSNACIDKIVKKLRNSLHQTKSGNIFTHHDKSVVQDDEIGLQWDPAELSLDSSVDCQTNIRNQEITNSTRKDFEKVRASELELNKQGTDDLRTENSVQGQIAQCTDIDQSLSKLYSDLVSPVQEHLTGNKLLIVPQGPLFSLPFAAFLDSDNSRLCEKYSIQVTPSLHTLNLSLKIPLQKLGPALFVGNPRVGTVEIRAQNYTPIDLPNSKIEAEDCGRFFNARPIVHQDATKEAVLSKMKTASVIHIAAHGDAEYADIFLAPNVAATTPPTPEHYLLRATDIVGCRLNARLVVLSCCFSGCGEISAEGVVGIARAFLGAGARSVLATLWQIPDKETLTFMKMFYGNVCQGYSVCVALQRTMITLKEEHRIGHWAASEILGEDITFTKNDIEEIRRQSSKGS